MEKKQRHSTETDGPIFRMLEKSDIQSVLRLMEEIKPNIGGSRDQSLYHALCHEALLDKRVVFTVGEEQSKIITFYLAIIDRNRWRMSFISRHPFLGARLAVSRTFNKFRKIIKKATHKTRNIEPSLSNISEYITPVSSNRSWKDSSPKIVKLLFLAVAESHRRKHIAEEMVEYTLKVSAERGARRADGIILFNNIPSIRLIHGLGFSFFRQGGSLFVTKDIHV
jgi:ribosomal protein S18 acetylase RimI-like enzyme